MTKIKGQNEGPNGRNEHYDIGSRHNISNEPSLEQIAKEYIEGKRILVQRSLLGTLSGFTLSVVKADSAEIGSKPLVKEITLKELTMLKDDSYCRNGEEVEAFLGLLEPKISCGGD